MYVSRPIKIFVGVGTAWVLLSPILLFLAWFAMVPIMMLLGPQVSDEFPQGFFVPMLFFVAVSLLGGLVRLTLQVFYLMHVIRNVSASEIARVLLGVGVFLLPFLAMPIYFVLFLWMPNPPSWALAPPLPVPSAASDSQPSR
jgi:hypothetical protein